MTYVKYLTTQFIHLLANVISKYFCFGIFAKLSTFNYKLMLLIALKGVLWEQATNILADVQNDKLNTYSIKMFQIGLDSR